MLDVFTVFSMHSGPEPHVCLGDDSRVHYTAVATEPSTPLIVPARYVLLPLANAITGYTVKAMERKIERGDWAEGKVWRRAPDGRILIDLQGYQRWVENR